jgi:hypothetical protein
MFKSKAYTQTVQNIVKFFFNCGQLQGAMSHFGRMLSRSVYLGSFQRVKEKSVGCSHASAFGPIEIVPIA